MHAIEQTSIQQFETQKAVLPMTVTRYMLKSLAAQDVWLPPKASVTFDGRLSMEAPSCRQKSPLNASAK